jgi:hypothetical protein
MATRRRKDTRVKDALLLDAVDLFFNEPKNWQHMLAVLYPSRKRKSSTKTTNNTDNNTNNTAVSLRLLDYLCTVYAYEESQRCVVRTVDGQQKPLMEVYEASLDAYGKSHYDCFRRASRLDMAKHGQKLCTTLGQLMFFKDIIENGILEFAREHADEIKEHMQGRSTSSTAAGRKRGKTVQLISSSTCLATL